MIKVIKSYIERCYINASGVFSYKRFRFGGYLTISEVVFGYLYEAYQHRLTICFGCIHVWAEKIK